MHGNGSLAIPEDKLEQFKVDAKLGSEDAALRLYKHYFYFRSDWDAGMHWLQIAAENGSLIAAENFAKRLLDIHRDEYGARF